MASSARKSLHPATEAALWTLSNGTCYYPKCPEPTVKAVRANVFRKNVQIAHIHGVAGNAPRYLSTMPAEEREAFGNLMLMCTAHHAEIDDRRIGEELYPADLLRSWKAEHEGKHGGQLAPLKNITDEKLERWLLHVFTPPVDRLRAIADDLARTGADNSVAVQQLRDIANILSGVPAGVDPRTASRLSYAAEVFEGTSLSSTARLLSESAQRLCGRDFERTVKTLAEAAHRIR